MTFYNEPYLRPSFNHDSHISLHNVFYIRDTSRCIYRDNIIYEEL